jgi:hypothetical protein
MSAPPMEFDTEKWLSDAQLSNCQPATRGIWIDAICRMQDSRSGALTGTPQQLAVSLRCTESALMSAIDDLQTTGAADVEQRNGKITLVNRRMLRDAKAREYNRLRQKRFREKGGCNADHNGPVTEMSHPQGISNTDYLFDLFYKEYPRKENPQKAREAFRHAGITEAMLPDLIAWLQKAKESEQWQDKSKIPHPTTWLNQKRWLGDPPPPPKNQSQFAYGERRTNGPHQPGGDRPRNPRSVLVYDPERI